MARKVRARFIPRNELAVAIAAALGSFAPTAQAQLAADALPTGGSVASGSATIATPAAGQMQINQASDKAILNWQSFSIGSGAWVNFSQPSASAIALNRVTGSNPSQIFGRLSANGQVFLSNPSGVLFAPGASVEVGALFATTLGIADADFLSAGSNYNFFNAGAAGSVVNQASITAGSYAALAAPQVRNEGVIVAQSGVVALAAGDRVSLDMAGDGLISVRVDQAALNAAALNSGSIQADGGRVVLTTGSANALLDTVVNNSGVIRANSLVERDGEIVLDGGSAGTVQQAGALQGTGARMTLTGGQVSLEAGSTLDGSASAIALDAATDLTLDTPVFAPSAAFTAHAGRDMAVNGFVGAGTMDVSVGGTLSLNATTRDAVLDARGGQVIAAQTLVLHAEDGHRAALQNTGASQAITVQSGGITLDVLEAQGVAQISNVRGAVTDGAQTVSTTGALQVVGGSTPSGSVNSGIFQGQTGVQSVSAGSITLQAATTGSAGGAFISNNSNGGGDQEVHVTGSLQLFAGAEGSRNRAGIVSSRNQAITGGADIMLRGGDSGSGTSAELTSNGAFISANAGAQSIEAGNITLQAGAGGSDTFASITGGSQVIQASGDVVLRGGSAAPGTGNGARIGGPGGAINGPTNLHLTAHNVEITGGSTTGAALGSGVGGGPRNDITVEATGDLTLTSNGAGGVRIGYGPSDPAGGSLNVHADGNITLSATGRGSVIRSLDDVTLSAGGAINESGNSNVISSSLTTSSGGDTFLSSFNQAGTFAGTSGGDLLLNNFGFLSLGNINAGGTLTLSNNGALAVTASGGQDTIVSSGFGQTISARSITVEGRDGRRAILINANGDQQIGATAGDIDLVGVNGQGLAKIVNGLPEFGSFGNQTVSASGDLNIVGGAALGGTGGRFSNSGISQNNGGTQTIAAANIVLQGSHFVDNGGALISNQNGGGNQTIETSGDIRITAGSFGTGNRAGIFTNGEQSVSTGGDIVITGGAGGGGDAPSGTSNSATIEKRGPGQQTVSARNIAVTAGSGGVDTSATLTGTTQVIVATGDVEINGSSGNTGSFNGARIGGPGSGSSDLTLSAANVLLNGGTASGAAIGGNATSGAPQNISITATGDVAMRALNGRGVRIGTVPGAAAPGNIHIGAGGNIELDAPSASATITSAGTVDLHAGGAITETGNAFVSADTLTSSSLGDTRLGGPNRIFNFSGTSGGDFALNNLADLSIGGVTSAGAMTLRNAGTILLLADGGSDALITSNGGQSISADRLVVDALNDRLARIVNFGGDQTVTVGSGGIDLTVVDGHGAAQIVNARGFGTDGAQTISTTGLLKVWGGSTSDFRGTNSGLFQSQTGKQTVTAGSIELQAAVAPVTAGGAFITSFDGGRNSDQEINVAEGAIRLTGGGVGFTNRALISAGGNQVINGNADIFVTGGSSGVGTGGVANSASISINRSDKSQTIHAHDIVVQAGSGGTDTSAAIIGDHQTITATGNVHLTGGANSGSASGARIGAAGSTATGTNLTLSAHNVVLTGGDTVSGAAIGNSGAAGALPSNISITATGDVILNSGAGNGARIGTPNGATGGGLVDIDAVGSIVLNGGAHGANIRTSGDMTLRAAGISETGNAEISAGSLTVNVDGAAQLAGDNHVSSFRGTSGGDMTLGNSGDLSVTGITAGGILALGNAGTLTLSANGGNDVLITSNGGQSIDAGALVLHAQDGGLARIINIGGDQAITTRAGIDLTAVGGQGAAQIVNARGGLIGGTQTVSTEGLLYVLGGVTGGDLRGTNSGVFQSQTGKQTVTAGSIELQAANAPVTLGGAFITSFDGGPTSEQEINVAAGTIRIAGGGMGFSNRALISSGGNQTINGNADIFVTGGSSGLGSNSAGTNNSASISANRGGAQTISAHDITVQAGSGGVDTNAAIIANSQTITATGDVMITGGANSGSAAGARIGASGNSTSGTNLTLSARNVVLTGGDTSGAALGNSSAAGALPSNVSITATGDVLLASGGGGRARIGAPNGGTGGGSVTLNASSVNEDANGQIIADSLVLTTGGAAQLGGANAIGVLNGLVGGNLTLVNEGRLEITGLLSGAASLTTIGAGSDLQVTGNVFTSGDATVNVAGAFVVDAAGAHDASFNSIGSQTIHAGALSVSAREGRFASIGQSGLGSQSIAIAGGSIDVQALEGSSASISAENSQTINLIGGDHFRVEGVGGNASVGAFGGGQTVSLTGGGANALIISSAGASASASFVSSAQSITAGAAGENGSITITTQSAFGGTGLYTTTPTGASQTVSTSGALSIVADGTFAEIGASGGQAISAGSLAVVGQNGGSAQIFNAGGDQVVSVGAGGIDLSSVAGAGTAQISSFAPFPLPDGTPSPVPSNGMQSVHTTGTLNVVGGSAAFNANSGVFQSQSGQQTISAANISLHGADAGDNGRALISAFGGGDQTIDVTGLLSITGGSNGLANRAGIQTGGNQTITGNADIVVTGGASGTGTNPQGTSNAAFISANTPGRQQTIEARSITLNAGSGGTDTFAVITSPTQAITVSGDVKINGSDGNNGAFGGARIGGAGAGPTHLTLAADNVLVHGGAASGAAIGSNTTSSASNDIAINAEHDITLDAGIGGGVRIGTAPARLPGSGTISLLAGGNIALNGASSGASVNTAGEVALTADGTISEAGDALITAGTLTTVSGGSTLLGGANHVHRFNATSAAGDVLLFNYEPLEVTGLSAFGNATLDNTGGVTISGPWAAGGTTSITVHSDLVLQSTLQSQQVLLKATSGSIREQGDGAIDAASLATSSVGDTVLQGANTVGTFAAASDTGSVSLVNTGPLEVASVAAPGGLELTNEGPVTLTTPIDGPLTIASHGNLDITRSVQARSLVLRSDTGNITVGGANAAEATVVAASDWLMMSAPGDVLVRGSDCSAGAGAYVIAGGLLDVRARSFSLVAGAAPYAPAMAAGNVVNVATQGDLTLTGGGYYSPALLFSSTGIDLTIGGTLKIDGGTAEGSQARIQTATTDGEIRITFLNQSGGYLVDGFADRIKHGPDGFYTGLKPAKEGDTFFVDYE